MFGAFERMVAFRYLRARKGERFVSVIATFSLVGIALGVATLIIVMSVMNGFRQELLGRILGLNGHLGIYAADGGGLRDFDSVLARVRGLPGITSAAPVVEGQVLLTSEGGGATGGFARGIRPEDLKARPILAGNIVSGTLDQFGGEDTIIIGTRLAQKLRLGVGGKVTLVSPQGRTTVIGMVPRLKAYTIVALFDTGMNEYDSGYVFMPLQAAQTYFQLRDAASQIEIFVQNPDQVRQVTQEIVRTLSPMPFRVLDWQASNSSFFAAVQVERNVMFLILTLIIVVAAFNIISSLIMLVKDKGRDIAILRTMGASSGAIMRIFLLCGASIGVLGTLIGFGIGLVFCLNIERIRQALQSLTGTQLFSPEVYFLTRLPAIVDPNEVTQVVLMGLGLSLLATLYPSWRAAKTDPVEALRNE
ncbi:lipoprotein-releasing ABC transporter permease subunit [Pseudoroseomonas ludipueritiae]|uniref:Lipoprotein-releasing ABC transporter permease subunit n=1 Tax=Pseudoroseomonas ludipueritiae TaxID=198093 RepID=A0ABR7R6Z6_9PROT|nr:lipoprotein-releasing ABC transporter permease subunit [Pseudoroseomonas ludipueritiae]MBC9177544.1 lipoprotein-releasing ABC transporter permease subunit [Pseudoroseomonas ludipueritiae]MCG7363404.1 lipoprotein-releasing ABC transporter permease subunit [Roseomonas sp. ACRSG]